MKCLYCGLELKGAQTKFCCPKHAQKFRYAMHRQDFIDRAAVWAKKHPRKCRKINRAAVNKFLVNKRERFNKLCCLNRYRKKVAKLEKELKEENDD